MKIYEKPDVEYVSLAPEEAIALSGGGLFGSESNSLGGGFGV